MRRGRCSEGTKDCRGHLYEAVARSSCGHGRMRGSLCGAHLLLLLALPLLLAARRRRCPVCREPLSWRLAVDEELVYLMRADGLLREGRAISFIAMEETGEKK